jgi:phage/plasmid-like protein (TIGR03299 family)
MAHEIQQNDGVALANTGAWHGLGTVVQGTMSPADALKTARLDWTVEESDAITGIFGAGSDSEYRVSTDASKILIRSDDKSVLSVVGADYAPFQNQSLADLAYAMQSASAGAVEVETAGSIRGGKRVWMLLQGNTVQYGGEGDTARPYLLLANGHDGTLALHVIPTCVRVVCSNTFHAALGSTRRSLSFRHTSDLATKRDELADCVKAWRNTIDSGADTARRLASIPVDREKVRALWVDVIQSLDGQEIPFDPQTPAEQRRKDRAVAALAHASRVFDVESQTYGANLWVAANAATNWIQHERAPANARTKDRLALAYSAFDGQVAEDVSDTFRIALAHA